ncbi:hypothetical protein Pcinc_024428 [Petrolisthes cinctipes]|uniref:Uncharacterized protein n=1 Tax=Petrolisthes cinctipes TaxID=88211 RepID=A0AAE1F9X9_PETCI|nr:hypothetical protein Pcinc_024428 [Petrolisthes cinctipes]
MSGETGHHRERVLIPARCGPETGVTSKDGERAKSEKVGKDVMGKRRGRRRSAEEEGEVKEGEMMEIGVEILLGSEMLRRQEKSETSSGSGGPAKKEVHDMWRPRVARIHLQRMTYFKTGHGIFMLGHVAPS